MIFAFILLGAVIGGLTIPFARWALRKSPSHAPDVYQEVAGRALVGAILAFLAWRILIDPDPPNPDAGDPYTSGLDPRRLSDKSDQSWHATCPAPELANSGGQNPDACASNRI